MVFENIEVFVVNGEGDESGDVGDVGEEGAES